MAEQLEVRRTELAAVHGEAGRARAELEAARRYQARVRQNAARLSGALANRNEALVEMLLAGVPAPASADGPDAPPLPAPSARSR